MIKLITLIIHILNLLTIVYMIFKEKRSANRIIAWTLILYIAPIIGFVLFALLGRQINQKKMYRFNHEEIEVFKEHANTVNERKERLKREAHLRNQDKIQLWNEDMIQTLEHIDYSPYRTNNDVWLYSDGEEFFSELKNSLRAAQKLINIQFYIFKSDEIGTEILKILGEKAKSGVEVRLLYDSVGSRSLNRKLLKELKGHGVKTAEFFPSFLKYFNINMNYRNHRKIVVIDNHIGFVGGFNIGDEYLGKDKKFGYWRDTHIKFCGDAVKDLNLRFLADWRYVSKEEHCMKHVLGFVNDQAPHGDKGMQIVSSGPNLGKKYEIKLSYLKMIQKARRYVYVQSPYLILDNSLLDSLKLAAYSGVDVRIMIPGKGDHPFVYWANSVYAGELLSYGVRIFEYNPEAFLHAKTVVIDDDVCSVGTANMDTRSFELNFEVNAFIYSSEIAKKQRMEFERDIKDSKERTLEDYQNRSKMVKAKEAISKLLSGVL